MKKILCMLLACVMVLGIIMPMATLAESTESTDKTVYANGKVWFDLNGNSKLFINTQAEDYADRFTMEFLPGVDYSGLVIKPTGDFEADKLAIKWNTNDAFGGAAMPYSIDANPAIAKVADLKSDASGNLWYTFEDDAYLIRPTENVIKIAYAAVDTSLLSDPEIIAKYKSVKEGTTIDIPDGKYSSIGFFAAVRNNFTKAVEVSLYYEGESQPEKKNFLLTKYGTTEADIYFNYLNKNATGSPEWNSRHSLTRVEFPIEAGKVLEKIKIADPGVDENGTMRNIAVTTQVISVWGVETTLEEKIAELNVLNEAGVTDADSYNATKEAVAAVDKYIENYSVALTEDQKAVYDAAKVKISVYEAALAQEKLYAQNKEWFDLNGNSKLFIDKNSADYTNRASLTNYLPGVDYAGYLAAPTGVFATDRGAVVNQALAFFAYTVDKSTETNSLSETYSTPADFKTGEDGKLYFVYKDVPYRVDPTKNVIKLISKAITTSALTDSEAIARHKSLSTGVTMDIPDGYYKNIGFLTAVRNAYTKTFKLELYYEGEETPVTSDHKQTPPKTSSGGYAYDIYFHGLSSAGTSSTGHFFTPWNIEVDSSKKLEKIRIYDGTNNATWPIHIISSWGDEITLAERFTKLNTLNETGVTDENYQQVKEAVEEIEAVMAKTSADSSVLKAADKAIYDSAKANLKAYDDAIVQAEIYKENKEWFDLNGNAKFFINTKAADYADRFTMEFLPGVDYSGFVAKPTGDFATDKAAITNPGYGGSAMPYTIDKNPASPTLSTPADFKTGADGNLWYTFEGNDYLVRPEENVIKFVYKTVDTSNLTDEAMIERYESLKTGGIIDVPDGKYKNFGFLLAIRYNYSKAIDVSLYYKGEEEPTTVYTLSTNYGTTAADLYFKNLTSENGTSDYNCQHAFTRIVLDTDPSKVLEKIQITDNGYVSGKARNQEWPGYVISAWGDEVTLAEKFAALSALNTVGITDKVSYQKVAEAVEEIDAILDNAETTADSLKAEDKAIYETAIANLETYEVTFKNANDNLVVKSELEFKGNSKLFMDSTSEEYANKLTLTNYYPGLDYAGLVKQPKGDFAEDFAGADNTFGDYLACFGYTINKGTKPAAGTSIPDFTTGENGKIYWNVNDVDYMVRPTEKTIKLSEGVSLSGIKDAEIKAKYATLQEYTFDVPKGKYNTLTFLAGIVGKETYHRDANVTLIYEDGTTGEGTFNVRSTAVQSLTWAKGGVSFPRMISSTAAVWTRDYHTFAPYTVEADETKVLKAVKLTAIERNPSDAYKYPIYIVSISGSHTIKEVLSAVSSETSKEDAQVILDAVDKTLAENEITADDLTEETKAKYLIAKACTNTLEVVSAEYEASKVTVKYTTGVDTSAKVIVAEYENGEESLKAVKIFAAEFTANETTKEFSYEATTENVKVFVWKDMIGFFPYGK